MRLKRSFENIYFLTEKENPVERKNMSSQLNVAKSTRDASWYVDRMILPILAVISIVAMVLSVLTFIDGGSISDVSNLSGTVSSEHGGTGQTSFLEGQLLIGTSSGSLEKNKLAPGSNFVVTNGDGTITLGLPTTLSNLDSVTSDLIETKSLVTDTLTLGSGGLNLSDLASANITIANITTATISNLSVSSDTTTNQLTVNGNLTVVALRTLTADNIFCRSIFNRLAFDSANQPSGAIWGGLISSTPLFYTITRSGLAVTLTVDSFTPTSAGAFAVKPLFQVPNGFAPTRLTSFPIVYFNNGIYTTCLISIDSDRTVSISNINYVDGVFITAGAQQFPNGRSIAVTWSLVPSVVQ